MEYGLSSMMGNNVKTYKQKLLLPEIPPVDVEKRHRKEFIYLKNLLTLLMCFLLLMVSKFSFADKKQDSVLHLGILPHLSSNLLVKKYTNLVLYLEKELGKKIILSSAPDFKTYLERASANEYDIYLTAPHFAAYHVKEQNHSLLSRFSADLRCIFVVNESSPYSSLDQLKGKTITTPDTLAIITMLGESMLQQHGFDLETDLFFKRTTSHNSAVLSVSKMRAEAAIVGLSAFKITETRTETPLRILAQSENIPHMIFLASNNMASEDVLKIKQKLLAFTAEGEGKEFFANVPFKNMIPVTAQDIEKLQPLLNLLSKRLQ